MFLTPFDTLNLTKVQKFRILSILLELVDIMNMIFRLKLEGLIIYNRSLWGDSLSDSVNLL